MPPLVFAMLVIVPPQSYYQLVEGWPGGPGPVLDFYARYVTASGHWAPRGEVLITPTWNHMWFVAYLLVYSLLLAGVWAVARGPMTRLGERLGEGLAGWRLLVWPIIALAILRLTLAPLFEVTHALVDDWYTHAVSVSAFLFGFLTAKSLTLRDAFVRLRWPALILAAAAWALYAAYAWIYRADDVAPPLALQAVMAVVYSVDQWCAIAAILGFGGKHLTRGGPMLTYLTLGVFPFYIVHQSVIVVAGHHLAKVGFNQGLEASLLIATTFASCFLTYEIVRRVPLLRPLFGLRFR